MAKRKPIDQLAEDVKVGDILQVFSEGFKSVGYVIEILDTPEQQRKVIFLNSNWGHCSGKLPNLAIDTSEAYHTGYEILNRP